MVHHLRQCPQNLGQIGLDREISLQYPSLDAFSCLHASVFRSSHTYLVVVDGAATVVDSGTTVVDGVSIVVGAIVVKSSIGVVSIVVGAIVVKSSIGVVSAVTAVKNSAAETNTLNLMWQCFDMTLWILTLDNWYHGKHTLLANGVPPRYKGLPPGGTPS